MQPPIRDRITPFFADEKNWLIKNKCNINIEYDVPAFDKLKNKIKNEFMVDNDEYKIKEKPIIPMMMRFYDYIDKLNKIFRKYGPCKRGCSDCCLQHVTVTNIEKIIINNYIVNKKLMYRQIIHNEILSGNEYIKKYNGIECTFLENNKCSIYPARPFACRRFICLECDNNSCKEYDYIFKKIFQYLIEYSLKEEGKNKKLDLSDFSDIRDNYIKIIDK